MVINYSRKGAKMRILVFSAHQDDETLGAGGTIAKHVKNGDEVHLGIVTSGYKPKWTDEILKLNKEEALKVKEILGIKHIYFLNFPAIKLDTVPKQDLNDSFIKIINNFQPEIIYTPFSGDIHQDHREVFQSVLVATRPVKNCPVKKVLAFEVASSTEWGAFSNKEVFKPNVFVDISDTLQIKIKAFKAYKRQIPHPRSIEAITIYAKYRGINVGMEAAEAFMLIRENVI